MNKCSPWTGPLRPVQGPLVGTHPNTGVGRFPPRMREHAFWEKDYLHKRGNGPIFMQKLHGVNDFIITLDVWRDVIQGAQNPKVDFYCGV